ncbi:hypothetical protein Tco_1374677 [Tanacetum coccineum]
MQSQKNESSSDDLKSANRHANLTIIELSLHLKMILEKVNIKLHLGQYPTQVSQDQEVMSTSSVPNYASSILQDSL